MAERRRIPINPSSLGPMEKNKVVAMDWLQQQPMEENKVVAVVDWLQQPMAMEENKVVAVVDWLQLPEDIISFILSKLPSIFDHARFGLVCLKWSSIIFNEAKSSLPPQPPLLVIPTPPEMMMMIKKKKNKKKKKKKKNDTSTISCSFYSLTDGKIFNRLKLTVPRDRQFRGSGFGWLITVDEELCYSVQLVNPFFYPNTATKEIKLPPLTAHPTELNNAAHLTFAHIRSPVLSADPILNPKDCVVMAIFGAYRRLSFCRPGDKAWTPMTNDSCRPGDKAWTPMTEDKLKRHFVYDLVYHQGNFYALNHDGDVLVCDVAKRTMTTFTEPHAFSIVGYRKYLVVSEGDFFQVHRYLDDDSNISTFIVLKYQRRSKTNTNWVVVKDLNNRAFFIGDSPSMSISPSDFPEYKPNCIYYTDDDVESHYWYYEDEREFGPHDLGVFNVQNGSFEKHYTSDVALWPAPIWIQPVLIPPRSKARSKKKNYC